MHAMHFNDDDDDGVDDDDLSMMQLAQLLADDSNLSVQADHDDVCIPHIETQHTGPHEHPPDDDGSKEDDTVALAHHAMQLAGTPGVIGRLLSLPNLTATVNPKQRQRIEQRRRTKIRIQSARVVLGYAQGGKVRGSAHRPSPLPRSHLDKASTLSPAFLLLCWVNAVQASLAPGTRSPPRARPTRPLRGHR